MERTELPKITEVHIWDQTEIVLLDGEDRSYIVTSDKVRGFEVDFMKLHNFSDTEESFINANGFYVYGKEFDLTFDIRLFFHNYPEKFEQYFKQIN